MQKILFFLFTVFYIINLSSQNNKIKFESVSIAFGGYQPSKGPNGNANFYFSTDATFNWKRNLFSASLNRGFDWDILIKGSRYNIELDFLYGREFKIYKWIFLQTHLGIGYFNGSYYKRDYETWENRWGFIKNQNNTKNNIRVGSIAFPLKLKLLFYTSQSFSLGGNLNYSFNNISNVSSYSIIFLKKF
ncbi:MAG: hypothetical protein GKR88_14155 [Flavobacteriaceae bacterium]|nr:MAG: hypothetical protein GKR88_14155 [Flavobacteriaceae bacterium]